MPKMYPEQNTYIQFEAYQMELVQKTKELISDMSHMMMSTC